jgi:phage terminase large subunit
VRSREAIRRDPVGFCRRVLGFDPWSKQREVLEAVRDYPRVAVRSANGVGKTSVAGRAVLWWLAAFPRSIVVTTSATWTQVREQLWRELAVAFHAADGFVDGVLTDTRLELAPDWFAIGLSTDQPERFTGYHSEHLLVVLDEASGVSEAVWEAAETLITSAGSHLLAIGNPTRLGGSFHRAFTRDRALYHRISISALEAPPSTSERVSAKALAELVGPAWIESRRRAWGEESPLWQVRVLGEFPSTADDTVVPLAAIEGAQRRRWAPGEPVVVGVDVARFGSDETVIATRRGSRVRIAKAYVGRDLMQTAGQVVAVARALQAEAAVLPSQVRIVVDDTGLGGGVTDRLREVAGDFDVVAFNGGERARDPESYPNRRSELWFAFAEKVDDLDLDRDEQLAADLVAPRYQLDSRARRVVESKAETKRRLGRSPDRADAVLLTFVESPAPWPVPSGLLRPPITADLLERPM